jgi:hypothetical protein
MGLHPCMGPDVIRSTTFSPHRNRQRVCSCVDLYHLVVRTLAHCELRHGYPLLLPNEQPSRMCLLRLLMLEKLLGHLSARHFNRSVERPVSVEDRSVDGTQVDSSGVPNTDSWCKRRYCTGDVGGWKENDVDGVTEAFIRAMKELLKLAAGE